MQVNERMDSPTIVAFCCNWCSYAGADLSGTNRLNYPADVKIIRIPCSCRLNPMFILRAFQRGADGVILCGCHPGDCHYTSGNYYARRRMTLLFSMLDYPGHREERTRVEWVSAAEGAKFAETMNEFVETITKLGENKQTGGSEMQEMQKEKARPSCLQTETVAPCDRLEERANWLRLPPPLFTTAEEMDAEFVYGDFSGANLSKYLIEAIPQGGQGAGLPKPCDTLQL